MNSKLEQAIHLCLDRAVQSEDDLRQIKREVSKQFGGSLPTNTDLLAVYRRLVEQTAILPHRALEQLLKTAQVRSTSGVAVITVLTKPYACPGRCVYCPTEARMPKSYLANEPAAARALHLEFDPFRQVFTRLRTLHANGHPVDKCELIVLGGTWTFYPKRYQTWFIKRCYDAFNACTTGDGGGSTSVTETLSRNQLPASRRERSLEAAKRQNETAACRVIGLTLETRPDHVTPEEVKRMRWLGATRVQLGVQTTDQKVLDLIKRDQTNQQVMQATRLLKEAGFKITHHYMQNLPGATIASDLKTIDDAFQTPDFQPDHVKIYPCVVIRTAELYHWWKQGTFRPYTAKQLSALLVEIKRRVPPYVRIERLIRDIPAESILDGNKTTNLRQVLQQKGVTCRCIRCREPRQQNVTLDQVKLVRREYPASGGREIFLSFESPDERICYAFCRLRLQSGTSLHWPVLQHAALIRELHTYGRLMPIGTDSSGAPQHQGFGRRLMSAAEQITKENGFQRMAVIAGVGVRAYYRKLGYQLEEEYMVKSL